ncbi:MAG: hypothetical protein EP341_02435 [Sphingomonadales bacterium]|nr:MAG: hypothetical protein EP341_02435 [Sphingomonadales bacterium]
MRPLASLVLLLAVSACIPVKSLRISNVTDSLLEVEVCGEAISEIAPDKRKRIYMPLTTCDAGIIAMQDGQQYHYSKQQLGRLLSLIGQASGKREKGEPRLTRRGWPSGIYLEVQWDGTGVISLIDHKTQEPLNSQPAPFPIAPVEITSVALD